MSKVCPICNGNDPECTYDPDDTSCEHGRSSPTICPHCIEQNAYESIKGTTALNKKLKEMGIGLMSKDTNKVSISNDTNSPESKAGFDSLVQGIIDGEIMTCLSPAHRSALRKQFERDRQEIERLEESTFFYRREFESATERVNYRDEELATLRAKAERLELALGDLLAEISEPGWTDERMNYEDRQITKGAVELARQALEGK